MIMWDVQNKKGYKLTQQKAICMEFGEFKQMVEDLTNGLKTVEYEFDGMFYSDTKKAFDSDEFWNQDVNETVGEYFGINVSSVHADDAEYVCDWIVYK